jgi:hypothetical protein
MINTDSSMPEQSADQIIKFLEVKNG